MLSKSAQADFGPCFDGRMGNTAGSRPSSGRPRVLLITPDFPPASGGIQVLSHRLASNFQRAEVHVVTLDGEGAGDFDRRISLRVTRVGLAAMPRPARVAALNAAVVWLSLRFRPDVVLCMHVALAPSAFAVRGLLSAPVALYLHAVEVRRRQRLARWATRRADAVIAVSSHTEGLARSRSSSRAAMASATAT